ncbi:STG [Mytilus edulis]|uniref:M-phase inducer phosphatase n=1 Tax=Mytilus edulis TaxID=6550 RepID=A0A8S3QGQ9_MYTED|nr:STG [Mytilus edulis]
MDTFTFADVSFTYDDEKDTSLEELRGSLPLFSPLRFTETDKRMRTPHDTHSTKRPRHAGGIHKSLSFGDHPVYQPSPSNGVKNAVSLLMDVDNVIGDGTAIFSLPTVKGKHSDLKSIDSNTLVGLQNGLYQDTVSGYQIIDCRYPYEYNGGHIKGAHNIYKEDDILQLLQAYQPNTQRDILIFHCEFSSERAPKLCRYLRNKDRELNSDKYPFLTFPELYILDGGYKSFYYSNKPCANLCPSNNFGLIGFFIKSFPIVQYVFDREVQKAKRKYWYTLQQELLLESKTDQQTFWKKIGKIGIASERKTLIPMEVVDANGNVSSNVDDVLLKWKSDYADLLNQTGNQVTTDRNIPVDQSPAVLTESDFLLTEEISFEEVFNVVCKSKRGKASGVDNIPADSCQECLIFILKNGKVLLVHPLPDGEMGGIN